MASKHMVTCRECGKRFDANYGGYYDRKSRRYTCKKCGNSIRKAYRNEIHAQQTAEREERIGMRQSFGAMIAKIAGGIIFILTGFSSPESGWTFGYFLTALVIGAALIAWGLLPYLKAKKTHTVEQENVNIKVCESCGATGTGDICEYCGNKL